jgi:hypothetical protein
MRPVMSALCLAFLSVATACSEATPTGVASPLVGEWTSPRENLQPNGTLTRDLVISGTGEFTYRTNMYGIYGGGSPATLAAYTQTSGTYTIDGDKLVLTANRIATWDSFYGATSPERVEQVNQIVFDQARFNIVGWILTLDYVSYPADAPEPTRLAFVRLGLD